ncbi:hypothetical protein [Plebeiibacterium sediminum]|uniref:Uncharacterized protein n=1 Tax=Plebeiibacterium sediminum TaxID=2992112 RepID=A0AAE3SHJ2_9BACT|nr:hypothetical protein [Plebeiobacterium sediminum]MCW3789658.1 hypothetical protein [Plebeiobacterium sediminum]
MEKRLVHKLKMYKVVVDWLDKNKSQLESLPQFNDSFNALKTVVNDIEQLSISSSVETNGVTLDKAGSRMILIDLIIQVVRVLKVYATFTNNQIMMNDIDVTNSLLLRLSEQQLLVKAQKVVEHAKSIQSEAQNYGLTEEKIAELLEAYDTWHSKLSSVRTTVVERKNAGDQLDAHINVADDILKGKIDLLLDLSQNTQPDLYNEYKASREIVNR